MHTCNPSTWENNAGEFETSQACIAKSYQKAVRIRESKQEVGVAYQSGATIDETSYCNFLGSLSECDPQGMLMLPWRTGTSMGMIETADVHRTVANQRRCPLTSRKEQICAHWISNPAQLHSSSVRLRKTPSLPSALASSSSSNCVLVTLALGCHEHSTLLCTWCMEACNWWQLVLT